VNGKNNKVIKITNRCKWCPDNKAVVGVAVENYSLSMLERAVPIKQLEIKNLLPFLLPNPSVA
jgi:hypothetical protein